MRSPSMKPNGSDVHVLQVNTVMKSGLIAFFKLAAGEFSFGNELKFYKVYGIVRLFVRLIFKFIIHQINIQVP